MGKQKTKQSDDSCKSHPSLELQKPSPPPHHQVEIRLDLPRWPVFRLISHSALTLVSGHQNTSTLSVITMIHDTWSADDSRHYQQIRENQDFSENNHTPCPACAYKARRLPTHTEVLEVNKTDRHMLRWLDSLVHPAPTPTWDVRISTLVSAPVLCSSPKFLLQSKSSISHLSLTLTWLLVDGFLWSLSLRMHIIMTIRRLTTLISLLLYSFQLLHQLHHQRRRKSEMKNTQ